MSDRYQVEADIPITRMKRFHLITDPEGEPVWRASRWSEVIEWLYDREQTAFDLIIDGKPWLCQIEPPSKTRSPD